MQFLTCEQAQRQPYMAQYRHSPAMSLLGLLTVLAVLSGCGVLAYMAWQQNKLLGLVLGGWFGLWGALFAILVAGTLRKRLLPTNWLLRSHTNGISIKFRSYLNAHFDAHDAIVAYIGYSDIEYARARRILQEVPGRRRGEIETRFLRFVEFKLRDTAELESLDQHVAAERQLKAPLTGRYIRQSRKDGDYPVQVADGYLRIQWTVWPRLPRFMKELSGHVEIRDDVRSKEDFGQLKKATRREQEDALLKLIASGDRFGAIRVIKEVFGYNTTHAVQFLEELSARPGAARSEGTPGASRLPSS